MKLTKEQAEERTRNSETNDVYLLKVRMERDRCVRTDVKLRIKWGWEAGFMENHTVY